MITTGTIAKALRKNTTCPTGTLSPKPRMSDDITANSSADATLSTTPLERDAWRGRTAGVVRGCESITPSAAPEGGCVHALPVGSAMAKVRVSCAQQPERSCYFFVGLGPPTGGLTEPLARRR